MHTTTYEEPIGTTGTPLGRSEQIVVALLAVAAVTAAATLLIPGTVRGPEVMKGSAHGTALIMLVVAVPTAAVSLALLRRGLAQASLTLLGGVIFILYNGVLLIFNTPFNRLFFLNVATLSLAVCAIVAILAHTDVTALGERFLPGVPAVGISVFCLVVAALNALAWLAQTVPAVLSSDPPAFLDGTGVTTNPIFVLDLGFSLPLLAVGAIWLWQRRPWGYLIVGAMLTMFVIECLSIATDQWFGHSADPTSPVASSTMSPVFVVLAAVTMIPLGFMLRGTDQHGT